MKNSKIGKVIKPANTNPWPHEERVAMILARAGYRVEFIPKSGVKTADILLNRTEFEIKSPISPKIKAVERNLARASKQSPNIIFDSSRMKNVRDELILKQLIVRLKAGKGIKKIIFINKRDKIVDVNELI